MQERKALDAGAFKWIAHDVSLVMQAAIRSLVAAALLLAGGFVLIYAGLAHTNASRMDGFFTPQSTWAGDLCGVGAAVLWAATTVLIRATSLSHASAAKTASTSIVHLGGGRSPRSPTPAASPSSASR